MALLLCTFLMETFIFSTEHKTFTETVFNEVRYFLLSKFSVFPKESKMFALESSRKLKLIFFDFAARLAGSLRDFY